ncbi:MAG: UDP-N-acetylglucosamine 2-epimerase (non-hydrolyzing) [Hahellaceae bacterium]|nr:UDP-N-acetylglucosamine 2-epimerase (non-hydrolyzing) [Hahellaceae bacterium]
MNLRPQRVLLVFGTRPEAIKMAPLVLRLRASHHFDCRVAVTAQHRQMLDQVLELFSIRPDFDLDIMKPNQDLFDITSQVLLGMKSVLDACQPDVVMVHGDTTTCFAAALAAFYRQIPVAHIEAGLRTGNLAEPFPEEANRSLVGRLAHFHFAPTPRAKENLAREGVATDRIWVTGNTVIDALLKVRSHLNGCTPEQWTPHLPRETIEAIINLKAQNGKMILITGHRRENFGQGFEDLCTALRTLAKRHPDWLLIYPVHLNPNVIEPVHRLLGKTTNVHLIPPQDYLPFVWLLDRCDLVITDSGGIQEEAPSFGKPVLVTRNVTERPEAVEAGTVSLVGTAPELIINKACEILENPEVYQKMAEAHNPYGDGTAANQIHDALIHVLRQSP